MVHAEVSATVRAPAARVFEIYCDYRGWPALFPLTIAKVSPDYAQALRLRDEALIRRLMLVEGL